MEIAIGYMPVNRGRNIEQTLEACLEFINENKTFVLVLDESDASDRDKGLDGRKIFKLIEENSNHRGIQYYIAKDIRIGTNFITSDDFEIRDPKHTQINKLNLIFPQGNSERYMHHRLCAKLEFKDSLKQYFDFEGLYLTTQHNSAFFRPTTRAIQSFNAMSAQRNIQKRHIDYLSLLVRDQNTMFPGEGLFERILRSIFQLNCITDSIKWNYKLEYLEGDSGGLNGLATWFRDIGGFRYLKKIITIVDKIESMCVTKGKDREFGIKITPKHRIVPKSDHGILSINIKKN